MPWSAGVDRAASGCARSCSPTSSSTSWRPPRPGDGLTRRVVAADDLFAPSPAARLMAARPLSGRARRKALDGVKGWPADSPGALNAWLLFVTTKPPTWREKLLAWPDGPLTLGEPHDGFLYPDPIGFWTEVRRWSIELLRVHEPRWSTAECLALTALVHVGERPEHLALAQQDVPTAHDRVPRRAGLAVRPTSTWPPPPSPSPTRTAPASCTRGGGAPRPTELSSARHPNTRRCTACTGPKTCRCGCNGHRDHAEEAGLVRSGQSQ